MDCNEIMEQLQYVETKVENGIVFASYHGTWMGVTNEEVLNIMLNYNIYLKSNKDAEILSRYRGNFILVCLGGSKVFVSKSKSELLERKLNSGDQYAYLGLLGINPDDPSNFTCFVVSTILKLGPNHKPEGFEDISGRTIVDCHQSATIKYVAGTRRWATIFLELEDGRWRQEYFLLDTGAPTSFLWGRFARGLKGLKTMTMTSDPKLDYLTCIVEGRKVQLNITDSEHPDNRLHGINLLGTDFLNEFVIIDDYFEESCRLLQRYKKPEVVEL